ncbi:MAG TPA: hypothetical protein VNE21_05695 [Mycobacteriales bacterium]|nr:hypothetical protein [Mycobacteriales bacterium]
MDGETVGVRCPAGHDDVSRVWSAVALVGSAAGGSASPARSAGGAGRDSAGAGCCGGGCCG